jgi:hypothetical protein
MLGKRLILQAGVIGEADLGSEVLNQCRRIPVDPMGDLAAGVISSHRNVLSFDCKRCSSEESGQRPNLFGCEALMMPLPVFREA